ncbi:MAG: hypothetical protein KDE09_14830 [Anaerolineales bacterium]|nr:hypothetical protein [Anaerolineales bacterium]
MELARAAAKVIHLNGERLVGRTRLQKTFYFLEELDVGFNITFDYYHYGPYSEELSIAAEDAEALQLIDVEWKFTNAGTKYAVYSSHSNMEEEDVDIKRREVLKVLGKYDAVTLEIAATADYLSKNGFQKDPWGETKRRKPEKTNPDRITQASKLISELASLHH